MIKIINDERYQSTKKRKKSSTKKPKNGKIEYQIKILNLLDKGFYAQQISQKTLLSAKKLSLIINGLKNNGFITQIRKFPKLYQLTIKGKVLVDADPSEMDQKKYQKEKIENDLKPSWLKDIRVHKLRIKNKLIQKPSWLNDARVGNFRGMQVKKIQLQNWTKYLITFPYNNFNGLEKIEVCNKVIIYNFNRNKKEQNVSSKESLMNYLDSRFEDCKNAREFLNQKGFIIDMGDPTFCQKPHFAIESNSSKEIGSLGKYLNLTVKTPEDVREIDDSPKTGGEEETDNVEKAKSYFDIPREIEEMKIAMSEMVSQMKIMAQAFTSFFKQPDNQIPNNSRGMFG